jgi:RNA polymerase sigma-70 factor, ECF subfamily
MLPSVAAARDDDENDKRKSLRLVRPDDATAHERGESPAGRGEPGQRSTAAIEEALPWDPKCGSDPEVFHSVFLRFAKPVIAFIYHMIGDRHRSEELAQETFLRAFRERGRVHEGVRISTWIFGIARNVALEAIRDRSRRRHEIGLDDLALEAVHDGKDNPSETYMSEELRRAIRRSLAQLTEDQRLVFVLKLLHQMRYEEISLITGSSIGKLKTDLHRARQQMREKLEPYLDGRRNMR